MEISSGKRRVLTWVLGVLCATALVPGIAQATTSSAASATETAAVASAGTDATSSSSAASSASSDGTAPEPELSTPADLVGKELGVTAGGVYDQIVMDTVEGVDESSFSYYENVSDSAAAVKSGKIDADIEFSATAELVVAQNEGLTIMPTPIVSDKIGICLKKDSPLTEKFNERLAAYRADGTLDRLHAEWMSADEDSKSMPAQDWDAPNGTLRVICSTLEPMSYVGGNGEMRGYEPELMLYIARDLGYRVEFSNATFAGVIASVESGKVDVALGCISITEERREQMDMTESDYDGAAVAIVRAKSDSTSGSSDFFGNVTKSFQKTFIEESRWRLIVSGLGITVLISVCSGALGVLLGYLTVLARRAGNRWIGKLVDGYQAIMGGVPIVVVLMVLYYVIFGTFDIEGWVVAVIAFTLSFGATAGTTMWTAICGMDAVQEESGLALGYTHAEVFRKIIFPQALQQFLPQLVGQFVSLVKETAVVGYIAVQDLTRASDLIRARTMDAFFPLISSAIIYFIICRLLALVLGKLTARIRIENRPRTIEGVEL